jgi:hypothetical protein
MPGQNSPVAPAWAVVDGKLYIAAWPQVVAGVLENKTPRLLESAEFRAMRSKLNPGASALFYLNDPQLLRQFYGVLVGGGTMIMSKGAPGMADVLRPEMIPSLPTLLKYVKPELRSVSADDKGILFEAYGTLPGPTALAPIAAPLAAMVAVNRGQNVAVSNEAPAQQNVAVMEMTALAKTITVYVDTFGTRLPDSPADLYTAGGNLPKGVSYVGKGIDIHSAAIVKQPVVIAYDRVPGPGPHRMSAVLYSDGHVETINEGKLQEELARTRQAPKLLPNQATSAPAGTF